MPFDTPVFVAIIAIAYASLIPATLGALIAGQKGRDRVAWAGVCWFFGLLGLVVIACLSEAESEYRAWVAEQHR